MPRNNRYRLSMIEEEDRRSIGSTEEISVGMYSDETPFRAPPSHTPAPRAPAASRVRPSAVGRTSGSVQPTVDIKLELVYWILFFVSDRRSIPDLYKDGALTKLFFNYFEQLMKMNLNAYRNDDEDSAAFREQQIRLLIQAPKYKEFTFSPGTLLCLSYLIFPYATRLPEDHFSDFEESALIEAWGEGSLGAKLFLDGGGSAIDQLRQFDYYNHQAMPPPAVIAAAGAGSRATIIDIDDGYNTDENFCDSDSESGTSSKPRTPGFRREKLQDFRATRRSVFTLRSSAVRARTRALSEPRMNQAVADTLVSFFGDYLTVVIKELLKMETILRSEREIDTNFF